MSIAWEDLKTVLAVVRHKTLSKAGDDLGVNYTTVARRIQRLEAEMGRVLFERLADGYHANEAGKFVADRAAAMERTEHAMMRALTGQDNTLHGPLVITAPQLLLAEVLGPMLDEFHKEYPSIDLQIRATNELLDLDRREADLAIRISDNPGDDLKGLRLTEQHTASFATEAVARDIQAAPSRIVDWIAFVTMSEPPKAVDPKYPNHRIKFHFDDMVAIQGAARAGLGVARLPMFLGRNTPGLVQIDVLPPQPYLPIWVVGHKDVWPNAKVAAFRAILVRYIKQTKPLFID